jgi:hypothetical protein
MTSGSHFSVVSGSRLSMLSSPRFSFMLFLPDKALAGAAPEGNGHAVRGDERNPLRHQDDLAKHTQYVVLIHFQIPQFITGAAYDLVTQWTKTAWFGGRG